MNLSISHLSVWYHGTDLYTLSVGANTVMAEEPSVAAERREGTFFTRDNNVVRPAACNQERERIFINYANKDCWNKEREIYYSIKHEKLTR